MGRGGGACNVHPASFSVHPGYVTEDDPENWQGTSGEQRGPHRVESTGEPFCRKIGQQVIVNTDVTAVAV